jgi:hypothetical protein
MGDQNRVSDDARVAASEGTLRGRSTRSLGRSISDCRLQTSMPFGGSRVHAVRPCLARCPICSARSSRSLVGKLRLSSR